MTDEMLALARDNASQAGVDNVEFLKGVIEDVPLPESAVDVVISNCVINLSTDKETVFGEIARVLRPGGRLGVATSWPRTVFRRRSGRNWAVCRVYRRRGLSEGET